MLTALPTITRWGTSIGPLVFFGTGVTSGERGAHTLVPDAPRFMTSFSFSRILGPLGLGRLSVLNSGE